MRKLGIIILVNLIIYLLGSFITLDYNPTNWWLLSTTIGRILFLIIEIAILVDHEEQ